MSKLIELSENHYIVVNDSEIKETGVYAYHTILKKVDLIQSLGIDNEYCKRYKKITHLTHCLKCSSYDFNSVGDFNNISYVCNNCGNEWKDIKPLSLSEVEEAINGYSVDDGLKYVLSLPNSEYLSYGVQKMLEDAYNKGFNAHKELVKDKLFTVEEIKSIIEWLNKNYSKTEDELARPYEDKGEDLPDTFFKDAYEEALNRAIKPFLPKTEWDVTFDEQGKIKFI